VKFRRCLSTAWQRPILRRTRWLPNTAEQNKRRAASPCISREPSSLCRLGDNDDIGSSQTLIIQKPEHAAQLILVFHGVGSNPIDIGA